MRMRWVLWTTVGLLASGCPEGGNGRDAGEDAGEDVADAGSFTTYTVEGADGGSLEPVAAAALPDDGVAIAYYHRVGVDSQDNPIYELRYRAFRDGAATAPETIATVVRIAGLSLAVSPSSGQPAVTYLGGNYAPPEYAYWFQNDAYLSYRGAGGSWSTTVVAARSDEAPGNTLSNSGTPNYLVGVDSALAFHGDEVLVAWRDCHAGQFGTQDYRASDLEFARGTLTSFPEKVIVIAADGLTVGKKGYGGDNKMVVAGGQPAIVGDQQENNLSGPGRDVLFFRRNADGSWTAPVNVMGTTVADVQLGPSLAHDATLGFAVAVLDASANRLLFTTSADGVTWELPQPLVEAGTSGWYPSLAVNPSSHEPEVAYYHCDPAAGRSLSTCRTTYDELRIRYRVGGVRWYDRVVDPEGGYQPTLLFRSSGKRAVVYRDPRTFAVKVALEP